MTNEELLELHSEVCLTFGIDVSMDCLECVFFRPLRTYRPCSCLRWPMGTGKTCAAKIEGHSKPDAVKIDCAYRAFENKRRRAHAKN